MNRLALPFVLILLIGSSCLGQADATQPPPAPATVSVCELTRNPQTYNGQRISVHAGVSMAFENFSIYDDACNEKGPGVWLTFGGDQDEVTAFCCAGPRKKGIDLDVEGHRIQLIRDDSLSEFLRVLQTRRLRR